MLFKGKSHNHRPMLTQAKFILSSVHVVFQHPVLKKTGKVV